MLESKLSVHWDIQNKATSSRQNWIFFVVDVPVGSLLSSVLTCHNIEDDRVTFPVDKYPAVLIFTRYLEVASFRYFHSVRSRPQTSATQSGNLLISLSLVTKHLHKNLTLLIYWPENPINAGKTNCGHSQGLTGPRGYSGFQVTGMIEWGQKSKPKKNP